MIWLGSKRGYISDWVTQRWVQFTGRRISLTSEPWLEGPIAPTTGISPEYFGALASHEGLRLHRSGYRSARVRGRGRRPSMSVKS
jgi:hypothetical protein